MPGKFNVSHLFFANEFIVWQIFENADFFLLDIRKDLIIY